MSLRKGKYLFSIMAVLIPELSKHTFLPLDSAKTLAFGLLMRFSWNYFWHPGNIHVGKG